MKNSGKPWNDAGSLRQLNGVHRRRVVHHREVSGRVAAGQIVFDHRERDRVVRHVAGQRREYSRRISAAGAERLAPARFLAPVGLDAERARCCGRRPAESTTAALRRMICCCERVGAAHVGRRRPCRHDVERHGRGIDADHPADDDAEIANRLRRHERIRRCAESTRVDPSSGAAGAAAGEPSSVTPDATTLYSIGHGDANARGGVVGDLVLRIPVVAIAEQPLRLRRHRRHVVRLRVALLDVPSDTIERFVLNALPRQPARVGDRQRHREIARHRRRQVDEHAVLVAHAQEQQPAEFVADDRRHVQAVGEAQRQHAERRAT